jgi:predicted nucleic acid-binding protein
VEKLFVDTDIILDLLAKREPHHKYTAAIFSLADQKEIKLFVSSLSFANLNYILSKQYNANNARKKLITFKTLTNVLAVNDKIVELALASDFKDFEDGIQYYTATENNISKLITRNLKDFKTAEIIVMTAEQFLKGG